MRINLSIFIFLFSRLTASAQFFIEQEVNDYIPATMFAQTRERNDTIADSIHTLSSILYKDYVFVTAGEEAIDYFTSGLNEDDSSELKASINFIIYEKIFQINWQFKNSIDPIHKTENGRNNLTTARLLIGVYPFVKSKNKFNSLRAQIGWKTYKPFSSNQIELAVGGKIFPYSKNAIVQLYYLRDIKQQYFLYNIASYIPIKYFKYLLIERLSLEFEYSRINYLHNNNHDLYRIGLNMEGLYHHYSLFGNIHWDKTWSHKFYSIGLRFYAPLEVLTKTSDSF